MSSERLVVVGTKVSCQQRDKLRLTAKERGYQNVCQFLKSLILGEIGGEDSEVNSSLTKETGVDCDE